MSHASDPLQRSLAKARLWLSSVARNMGGGTTDTEAYAALRSVLHALRDRLPVDAVAHLGAQLPLLVRGIYFEGWHPADKPIRLRHAEEFLALVERDLPRSQVDSETAARAVFRAIEQHIDAGEADKVLHLLPKEIRSLLTDPDASRAD